MSKLQFRIGLIEDLPVLQSIESAAASLFPPIALPRLFSQTLPQETLLNSLDESHLWAATHPQSGIVAFLAATTHTTSLHIEEMDVLPNHAHQGIGTALLKHACEQAIKEGFTHVTLTAFEHLPWNAPFYAKNGFRVVDPKEEFPHLAKQLEQERERGLERRVAMVKNTA
ncbi:MAG: GNAT family N-acetyltransferase [Betaproteobacteria bacterium]